MPLINNGRVTFANKETMKNSYFDDEKFDSTTEAEYLRQMSENDSRIIKTDKFTMSKRSTIKNQKNNFSNLSIFSNKPFEQFEQFTSPLRSLDNSSSKIFASKLMNKVTSWQVRVQIIEIKYLLGTNEEVFCQVEIGGNKFTTANKRIGSLTFNEVILTRKIKM